MPQVRVLLSVAAVTVAAAAAGVVLPATAAEAATVGTARVNGARVEYRANAGKTNHVTITASGRTVTIDDKVTVKPGKGCKRVGKDVTKVRCSTTKNVSWVVVQLGDRNDYLINKSELRLKGHGDSGNDTIIGGAADDDLFGYAGNDKLMGNGGGDSITGYEGNDTIDGGDGGDFLGGDEGKDTLLGRAGDDFLDGGDGNDRLWGGVGSDALDDGAPNTRMSGNDYFSGGPGLDELRYFRGESVTLDADGKKGDDGSKGEKDTIEADIETLAGGFGNDRLIGTSGADTLLGDEGADTLIGGGGDDALDGGPGKDKLDGGAHTSGDRCKKSSRDTLVRCEQHW